VVWRGGEGERVERDGDFVRSWLGLDGEVGLAVLCHVMFLHFFSYIISLCICFCLRSYLVILLLCIAKPLLFSSLLVSSDRVWKNQVSHD
jgi:hypothetical protein